MLGLTIFDLAWLMFDALYTTQTVQKLIDPIKNQYPQYQKLLQKHLMQTVRSTVSNNHEVQQLERIPVLGNSIQQSLNSAISTIVSGLIDRLIQDASAEEHQAVIILAIDSILEVLLQKENFQQTNLSNKLLINTIDLIVERVNVKQLKIDPSTNNSLYSFDL